MPERISAMLGGLMLFLSAAVVSAPLYPPAGLDMSGVDPSAERQYPPTSLSTPKRSASVT
jgi:hypothetical protein